MKFTVHSFLAVVGLVALVDAAAILADFQDRYLFASFAKELGVLVSGNTCNIGIGAKVLFWLQLGLELGIVALALSMRPSFSELKQAHEAWHFRSLKKTPFGASRFVLVLVFLALWYFFTYSNGYHESRRYPLCSASTMREVWDYFFFLLAFVVRGTGVVVACALYFDHKAAQASADQQLSPISTKAQQFRPLAPDDPADAKQGITRQMTNEAGVLITLRGRGREGQWTMNYFDPASGFEGELWAYRHDDVEKAWSTPVQDFWMVQFGAKFWSFLDRLPASSRSSRLDEIADNVADALLRWPTFGDVNATPATSVRILEPRQATVRKVVTRAT